MRFDKDQAMITFLEQIKATFSDPKAIDNVVYRSRALQMGEHGAIALSTSELLKAWTSKDDLDKRLGIQFVCQEQDEFEHKLYDIIKAKSRSTKQALILYSVILAAFHDTKGQIEAEKQPWIETRKACEQVKSPDTAHEKLLKYAKDNLARLSFNLTASVLDWVERLSEPVFESEEVNTLPQICYDYFQDPVSIPEKQFQQRVHEPYQSREAFLLDMQADKIDVAFVFGPMCQPFFSIALNEKVIFEKPFDRLKCRVIPKVHVGRVVSFDVIFEGHHFVLHHSAVGQSFLNEDENAYLLSEEEAAARDAKHIVDINRVGEYYQSEDKKPITTNPAARLLLYKAAIDTAVGQLEQLNVIRKEDSISGDIMTLGAIQSKLMQYDCRRLTKLKDGHHIPEALKKGERERNHALLSYLIETLNTSSLKENTALISVMLDLNNVTEEESNALQTQLAVKVAQEEGDVFAPIFLEKAIEHYALRSSRAILETTHQEQLKKWIVEYAKRSELWIRELLVADKIDKAREVVTSLDEVIQHYHLIFDEIAKESKDALLTLCRALEIHEHVSRNDFIHLLQLEHKLLLQMDALRSADDNGPDLSESEEALLYDYDDYFAKLEEDTDREKAAKKDYLCKQMQIARRDFLLNASTAPDQIAIQELNIDRLLQTLSRSDDLSIGNFIKERKEKRTPNIDIEKVPLTQVYPKSSLIIKIDDFSVEHLPLLNRLIANAYEQGAKTIKFVSMKSMETLIQQIVLPSEMVSTQVINKDIEVACFNTKSGMVEDDYWIVDCEVKQDPINALLVASYIIGGFNQAIQFFNGEEDTLNYDKLPGFAEYGFKHTPLLGLYRPKWLSERIDSTIKPPVKLESEEEQFFEQEIQPYLSDGILSRSYTKLSPFYQQYAKHVFYQYGHKIMPSCSREGKTRLTHALLKIIIDKIADYKTQFDVLEGCKKDIHEAGLLDYDYYASSKSASQERFAKHLAAMREDLFEPIANALLHVSEAFKLILASREYDAEQIRTFEKHIDALQVLSNTYHSHIQDMPDDSKQQLIRYLIRLKSKMRSSSLWEAIAETPWMELPTAWQLEIISRLKIRLESLQDIRKKKRLYIDAINLLKNKLTQTDKTIFNEALAVYSALKREIHTTYQQQDKQFFCNLLNEYMKSAMLFSEDTKTQNALVDAGYFDSYEAYTVWRQEEQRELIQLMSSTPLSIGDESEERTFLQNILELLSRDDLDELLKLQLSEPLCKKIASLAPSFDDPNLLERVSDCLRYPGLTEVVHQKLVDALYCNIRDYKNSLRFPKVLSDLHWREKMNSVSFSLTYFYELLSLYEKVASKELMEPIRTDLLYKAHTYFNAQLDLIENLLDQQIRTADIDALQKRLTSLEAFACFFEKNENVSFQRFKFMVLSEHIKDKMPCDTLMNQRKKSLSPALHDVELSKQIHRYLLREHNHLPVVGSPRDRAEKMLEEMCSLLLAEGNRVCGLSDEQTQLTTLPALIEHITQMTSDAEIASLDINNLSTLFHIKQFLRKLYTMSYEVGVNELIAKKCDGKQIDVDQLKAQLERMEQCHARLFLTALKHYIEGQAYLGAWQVGIQLDSHVIEIADKKYRLPKRVAIQYDAIKSALTQGENPEEQFDYVAIEKSVLDEAKKQYNCHSFWSGKMSKQYWNAFYLPHGARYDLELQLTDKLKLSEKRSCP